VQERVCETRRKRGTERKFGRERETDKEKTRVSLGEQVKKIAGEVLCVQEREGGGEIKT